MADAARLAFEILVREHHRALLAYAQALLAGCGRPGDHAGAEDLVQDALVIAYENLHRYDPARGSNFAAWVRGIMRLRLLKNARRRERFMDESMLMAVEQAQQDWLRPDPNAAPSGDQVDMLAALQICLTTLNDRLREVITAVYLKGQSLSAVAAATATTMAAVKKRLQRGRQILADCLGRRGMALGRIPEGGADVGS